MLSALSPQFSILASGTEAEPSEIGVLQSKYANIPEDYIRLAREATNLELKHQNGVYLRIWSPLRCLDMDEAYHISRSIPTSIPIGDDGRCNTLIYLLGPEGFGIYCVSLDYISLENTKWIAANLHELLVHAQGLESLRDYK